jgi:hypothetical protein
MTLQVASDSDSDATLPAVDSEIADGSERKAK